jgi:cellulose synthase operon protein C
MRIGTACETIGDLAMGGGIFLLTHLLFFSAFLFPQSDEDLLKFGTGLAVHGRLDEAIDVLDRYKQSHPDDPSAYLLTAEFLKKRGQLEDAALELEYATRRIPEDPELAHAFSRVLLEMDRLGPAVEVLEPFATHPEISSEALSFLADILYRKQSWEEALTALERYEETRPQDSQIPLRRGRIYLIGGQADRSVEWLKKAAAIDPENPPAFYSLGLARWALGDLTAALQAFSRAAELDPGNAAYQYHVGVIQIELEDFEGAIGTFEKATAFPGAFSRIYFLKAEAHRKLGQRAQMADALRAYHRLFQQEEEQKNRDLKIEQLLAQGQVQLQNDRVREAETSFQRILAEDDSHWLAHSYLAKIYLSSDVLHSARAHLERLEELRPESAESQFMFAHYWNQRGDFAKAHGYAQRAKRLRPGHPELRNLLGNILVQLGRRSEALEEYASAARLAPEREDYRLNLESLRRKMEPE